MSRRITYRPSTSRPGGFLPSVSEIHGKLGDFGRNLISNAQKGRWVSKGLNWLGAKNASKWVHDRGFGRRRRRRRSRR